MTSQGIKIASKSSHRNFGELFNRFELTAFNSVYSIHIRKVIDLTDYSLFTQWPRFRVKHLLEFVGSGAKLQLCY